LRESTPPRYESEPDRPAFKRLSKLGRQRSEQSSKTD
jgi:hypothetical protein